MDFATILKDHIPTFEPYEPIIYGCECGEWTPGSTYTVERGYYGTDRQYRDHIVAVLTKAAQA